jgi:hypothetical protein
MKLILTEKQLHQLKAFLFLKEQKSKKEKDTAIKGIESIGSKKEDKKEEKQEIKKPIVEKNKIKITSVKDLEKVLQVVAHSNKGLKVPTRVKSKFEKEIKFSSDIVSDLKNKLEKLIKTTSAVDHSSTEGKKDVFKVTNNRTDSTGKLKSATFKAQLRKALGVRSVQLPLDEVEIERQIIKDFLMKVSQDYSSNFVFQRAEGGKVTLTYGK